MTVLYILIPVAILLVAIAVLVFNWAVNSGQYDDLDGPAHSILFDDDDPLPPPAEPPASPAEPDNEPPKQPKPPGAAE